MLAPYRVGDGDTPYFSVLPRCSVSPCCEYCSNCRTPTTLWRFPQCDPIYEFTRYRVFLLVVGPIPMDSLHSDTGVSITKVMSISYLREYEPDADLVAIATTSSQDVLKRMPDGLVLYALGSSICSQRVRLTIEEKCLDYRERTLDFSISENLEPWYLELNPRGVVPTIVEGGRALFDSYTIMLFVNNQFLGPELTPDDPGTRDRMLELMRRADRFPIREFAYRWEQQQDRSDIWRMAMHDRVREYRDRYPAYAEMYDRKLAEFDSMERTVSDRKSMAELEALLTSTMDEFNDLLETHAWLSGDELSLADIAWLPILLRLQRTIDFEIIGASQRPNLNSFISRFRSRSAFSRAITDHLNDFKPQTDRLRCQAGDTE